MGETSFEYGFGGDSRDPKTEDCEMRSIIAGGDSATREKGKAAGTADIHVGDLLISAVGVFNGHISWTRWVDFMR